MSFPLIFLNFFIMYLLKDPGHLICRVSHSLGYFVVTAQTDRNTFQATKIRGKLNPQTFVKIFYGTQLILQGTGKKFNSKMTPF